MKKYAHLIARVGANIKKGQPVRIYAEAATKEAADALAQQIIDIAESIIK